MTRPPSLYPQVAGPEALPAPDTVFGEGPIGPAPLPAPPVDPGVSTAKIRAAELKALQEAPGFPRAALPSPDTIYGEGPIISDDDGDDPSGGSIDTGVSKAKIRAAELMAIQDAIGTPKPAEKNAPVKKEQAEQVPPEKTKPTDDLSIPDFLKREKPKEGEIIAAPEKPAEEKTIEQEMDDYRDKFNAFIKEAEAALDPKVVGLVRAFRPVVVSTSPGGSAITPRLSGNILMPDKCETLECCPE